VEGRVGGSASEATAEVVADGKADVGGKSIDEP
jgi:hypothetical protein